MPTARTLLQEGNARVFTIYQETEKYFYLANRYDDAFSKKFEKLTKIYSDLVGICFEEFHRNPNYMIAYMLEVVISQMMPMYDEETNLIVSWFFECNLHHDMSVLQSDKIKRVIYDTFKKWQGKRNLPTDECVKFVFFLLKDKNRFHYKHQHNQLFKLIEAHNENFKEDIVDIEWVKEACSTMNILHDEEEKNKYSNTERYCNLTEQYFKVK